MSPGLRRSWTQYLVVLASAIVMVPLLSALSQDLMLTWLGVLVLCAMAVMLFRWRRRLRAAFFLPLIYIALLGAMRFQVEGGIDSTRFNFAIVAFILMCMSGLLVNSFWSPYADDLDEMEHMSQSKE
jgi:lysylphosphatidylglycerol synthetase-like protein (DUF2156 family)